MHLRMVSFVAELNLRSFLHHDCFSFLGREARVEVGARAVASLSLLMSSLLLGASRCEVALSSSSNKKAVLAHQSAPGPRVRVKGGEGTTLLILAERAMPLPRLALTS
eukprot:9037174-Pyramimonas_sp.AAC.1